MPCISEPRQKRAVPSKAGSILYRGSIERLGLWLNESFSECDDACTIIHYSIRRLDCLIVRVSTKLDSSQCRWQYNNVGQRFFHRQSCRGESRDHGRVKSCVCSWQNSPFNTILHHLPPLSTLTVPSHANWGTCHLLNMQWRHVECGWALP